MRTDSPLQRWREKRAPRLLYAITALANVLVVLRLFGLFSSIGPSTDLLNGFCLGSWIALAVFHLAGGESTYDSMRVQGGDAHDRTSLNRVENPRTLRDGSEASAAGFASRDRVPEERDARPR